MYSLLRVLASLSRLSLASSGGALIELGRKAMTSFKTITSHYLKLAKLTIFGVILITLSGCETDSMINTYCFDAFPLRNYKTCPMALVEDIDKHNNRYKHKCMKL